MITGCGVSTDSSTSNSTGNGGTVVVVDDDDTTNIDGDDNSTDNGDGTVDIVVDTSGEGFDKVDATLDPNACKIDDTYQVIFDSSFDPLSAVDNDNGVEVASKYDYSIDLEATKVAMFYPDLNVGLMGTQANVYEELYRFGFDKSWVSNNLTSIYIRTPDLNDIGYGCYRYELTSLTSITKTKVYR